MDTYALYQIGMKDYTEIWQTKDSITTVVEANHYSIWELNQSDYGFVLELNEHLEDDAISLLCGQFPLVADYDGEGSHGTRITLYR